jgi:hypothetical protein
VTGQQLDAEVIREIVEDDRAVARALYSRRHRPPRDTGRIVIALAVLVAIVTCTAIAVSVYAVSSLSAQADRVERDLQTIQGSRVRVTREFCQQLNANARISNELTRYLADLVVRGTEQSVAFEGLYRERGLPTYRERLRQAQATSDRLDRLLIPIPDCDQEVERVQKEATP